MADMLISETLFFEMKDALSWYANADWGWNELDESIVRNWDQGIAHRLDHDFKDGGNVAKKTLERVNQLLAHHPF